MTREEYRNHVHTMVDLIMDIQEIDSEGKPAISANIYSVISCMTVWVYKGNGAEQYTTRYQKTSWDTPIEEIIEMLQNIKAELDKKEKFRHRPK